MTNPKFPIPKRLLKSLLLLSIFVFVGLGCNKQTPIKNNPPASSEVKSQLIENKLAKYQGQEGRTALDILKEKYTVTTRAFTGIGEYVTSINGIAETSGKNFWAFYINGMQSPEGAGSYITKSGDVIEWRLEEIKN